MLVFWVWFAQRSVPNSIKRTLLDVFGDPERIYHASPRELSGVPEMTQAAMEHLCEKDLDESRKILGKCREKGLKIIPFSHAAYPYRLKHIADPPMVLYMKGRLPDLETRPAIAVVGTRDCSPQGLDAARRISGEIAACGGIVVTGMAFGIDTQAALGSLDAGKGLIGVLGCGADVVYPKHNGDLFAAVLETGCVLSEFPPETPAAPWRFPQRNRIISGLCCGTVVVEAPEKSGALITARLALDQGRDVFVVPGSVETVSCKGSNALLRQGATAVFSGWDVVSEYAAAYPVFRADAPVISKKSSDFPVSKGKKQVKSQRKEKNIIDKAGQSPYSDLDKALPELTEQETAIVALLASGDYLTDDVAAKTGMGTGAVLSALTMLEIKGVIRRLPGNRIGLVERAK